MKMSIRPMLTIPTLGQTADVCVLRDCDDIQEKASYDAKEDETDAKYVISSGIEATEVDGANIADMHVDTVFGAPEPGLHEGSQDLDGSPLEGRRARSFAFRASEAIIRKLDVPETENRELEPHETDDRPDFNGQLERKLSNC